MQSRRLDNDYILAREREGLKERVEGSELHPTESGFVVEIFTGVSEIAAIVKYSDPAQGIIVHLGSLVGYALASKA